MRKKIIKRLTVLNCIKESECQDFRTAFPRVTDYTSKCAKYSPGALYIAMEMVELMKYLFEPRGRKKDPRRVEPPKVQVAKKYLQS